MNSSELLKICFAILAAGILKIFLDFIIKSNSKAKGNDEVIVKINGKKKVFKSNETQKIQDFLKKESKSVPV